MSVFDLRRPVGLDPNEPPVSRHQWCLLAVLPYTDCWARSGLLLLLRMSTTQSRCGLVRTARRIFPFLLVACGGAADTSDRAYQGVTFGKKALRISLEIGKTADRRSPVITVGIIRMIELANHNGVWMGRNVIG